MSFWIFLGAGCVLLGGGVCLFIFASKIATLRVLDPETSRTIREKKLRNRIMEDRMQRALETHMGSVARFFFVPLRAIQYAFQRIAGRLVAIERRYHRAHAQDIQASPEGLQSMLAEAERALREERFQVAEERLVELVSVAPKFAPAYEVFSRVYAAKREWGEAVESLICYVKLAPKDGDRRFLLGAMYEKQGEKEKAFTEYLRALEISPHNPKYLDAGIVLALILKKIDEATRMLAALQEANPENANIAVFSREIRELAEVGGADPLPERKRKK